SQRFDSPCVKLPPPVDEPAELRSLAAGCEACEASPSVFVASSLSHCSLSAPLMLSQRFDSPCVKVLPLSGCATPPAPRCAFDCAKLCALNPMKPEAIAAAMRRIFMTCSWKACSLSSKICAAVSGFHQRIQYEPDERGERDDHGLRNLLDLPQQHEGDRHDERRGHVGDRALAEHHDGARDGTDSGGGAAVDEGDDRRLAAVLAEVRRRDDGEKVAGQKGGERCDYCPGEAGDKIADETHRDDHRPRRDHRHRHGVDELPLGEPVMLIDHPTI